MCKIAVFPKNFDRDEAIFILENMENGNIDGTGFVYVENGEFVTKKWAKPVSKIIKNKKGFLAHLPNHNGWTLVHLRNASIGNICPENCHPFVINNWGIAHNGSFKDFNLIKLVMSSSGVKFDGTTDSEVMAKLITMIGPKKFTKEIDDAGVFACLNKNGLLHISKTGKSLYFNKKENGTIVIATEFEYLKYKDKDYFSNGWYLFGQKGNLMFKEEKPFENKSVWFNRGTNNVTVTQNTYNKGMNNVGFGNETPWSQAQKFLVQNGGIED